MIAQRLRRATAETATEAAWAFLSHWDAEEKLHFRLEEELLLPAYAAHGESDHVQLEEHEVFPLIEATIPESDLQVLGDRMRDARIDLP